MSADIRVTESRPFLPNTPAYDEFPVAAWQKCWRRVSRRRDRQSMGYGDPAGFAPLKRNIADYLALHRGDNCDPEQIVITPGGHAAFMLAALLLTNPGDGILFEDPGPSIARNLFASLNRRLVFAPVGTDGMNFEQIEARDPAIRMAFTMPSRHHPLGHTLSLTRRLRLLEWADKNDAWIIEDDYDSEFRYSGRPLTSMRSIDASERVIYVGTFSKALYPSLRVGYLVLPPALVDVFRNAMALIVRSPPLEVQMVLAEFIGEGYFATHLRHMRELYSIRRTHFIEAAKKTTTGLMKIDEPDSGMNMIAWLPDGVSDIGVYENAMIKGIYCYPLSHYCAVPNARSALILGFTNVQQQELVPGLERLSRIIKLVQKD
jgi:GntR family transcriptional regulator/MocR family aminotransferase